MIEVYDGTDHIPSINYPADIEGAVILVREYIHNNVHKPRAWGLADTGYLGLFKWYVSAARTDINVTVQEASTIKQGLCAMRRYFRKHKVSDEVIQATTDIINTLIAEIKAIPGNHASAPIDMQGLRYGH